MPEEMIGYPDGPEGFPTVYWQAWDVDATFIPGVHLPEESRGRLWAALVIVYYGDKVVLADIEGRGLCIPSGKIDPGETVDQAAEREVFEETGARLDPERRRLIGCYRMTPRSNPSPPTPLPSREREESSRTRGMRYCPVFVAEALGFEPIPEGSESRGIFLAAIEDLSDLYFTWDDLMAAVFDLAEQNRQTLLPSGTPIGNLEF